MKRKLVVIHHCNYQTTAVEKLLFRMNIPAIWLMATTAEDVGFWRGRMRPPNSKIFITVICLEGDIIVEEPAVGLSDNDLEVTIRQWLAPDRGLDLERCTAQPSAEHLARMREIGVEATPHIEISRERSDHVPHLGDGIQPPAKVIHPAVVNEGLANLRRQSEVVTAAPLTFGGEHLRPPQPVLDLDAERRRIEARDPVHMKNGGD